MADDTPDVTGYVERGGTGCPWCGADAQTEGDSVEIDQGASQEMGCHECGRSWHDLYQLHGILDMITPRYPETEPTASEQPTQGTVAEVLLRRAADELHAMHEEYCPDCQGGCPTRQLIADIRAVLPQTVPEKAGAA